MWRKFLTNGLHILFLKWVLAPFGAALLSWWIGDRLPRPTNWDLVFYPLAGILGFTACLLSIPWLARVIALLVSQKSSETADERPAAVKRPDAVKRPKPASPNCDLEFRTVNPQLCKGDPPSKAHCLAPPLEFALEWTEDKLKVIKDGAVWPAKSLRADGPPGDAGLSLVEQGNAVCAPELRAMTQGVRSLKMFAQKENLLKYRLHTSQSAGHGEFDIWVDLTFELDTKTVRCESYSRYNDCR